MEFKPPSELSFVGNVSENWKLWKQKLQNYLVATERSEKSDGTKIAIFLNLIGDEGLAIYNTFNLSKDDFKFDTVTKKFDEYCQDKKNVVFERHKFFKNVRVEGQTIDNYVTSLRTIGAHCEFDNQLENLIRDQIVLHLTDHGLQERILREGEISLDKVIDFVKASETTKEQVRVIQGSNVEVHGLKQGNQFKYQYKKNSEFSVINQRYDRRRISKDNIGRGDVSDVNLCSQCNTKHVPNNCPAFGKICHSCGKPNHFSAGCYKNKRRVRMIHEETGTALEEGEIYLNTLINYCALSQNTREYYVNQLQWSQILMINNRRIEFKLDTGAEVNVMPLSYLNKLGISESKLNSNKSIILEVFGGSKLKSSGIIKLRCFLNDKNFAELMFVTVEDNKHKLKPLLGLEGCVKLNLISRVNDINIGRDDFVKQNSDVFQGTGLIKDYECHIQVDTSKRPIVRPPRRVPLAIKERLKSKLDVLEREQIIEKIQGPIDWLSNLVIVEKKDGDLRICLDPTDLNQAIIKTPALIPTLQEVTSQLAGKSWFTVLDLKDGFYNIKLDLESSRLCAFSSPFGCYKFLRLPFGVSNAPEEFQRINSAIFADIDGLITYFDDILISAATEEEHDRILVRVINRARQYNVKFNASKLQYKTNEVKFLGFLFNKMGTKIDAERVKAIQVLEEPSNKKELQRLLGMLSYIRGFIPNFADLTNNLQLLLRSDVDFVWTATHSRLLREIKDMVSKAPVLAHFDSSKSVIIECDASKDALGCCLMQEGQPISYASRGLTAAEKNFAQIEKELLSLLYAASKFHMYIYGRRTVVRTDHKPLVAIVKKTVAQIPSHRLQRMVLKLIKYDLELTYVPGKKLYIADLLSRNYCKDVEAEEDCVAEMVHEIATSDYQLQVTERRKKIIEEETAKDSMLQQLIKYYMEGWPEKKELVPEKLKSYYKLKNEIHVAGSLVFVNQRLLVPASLRMEMLRKLHEPHLGIIKTQTRAKQLFYWPNINGDIEAFVSNCRVCEKYRSNNIKEPLMPLQVPKRPYERVGVDFCDYGNSSYLVVVDYLSAWFDIIKVNNKTALETVRILKQLFSTHGVPNELRADNMPFGSYAFRKFCQDWDITLINSSPHYPKANGMVEKAVGIAKNILRKCEATGQDFYLALLEYRNTPVSGLSASPSRILMSRQLRSLVPATKGHLMPQTVKIQEERMKVQSRTKEWYDRTSRRRKQFKPGESVVHRRGLTWEPALIIQKKDTPRSYIVKDEEGRQLTRNAIHLRQSSNAYQEKRRSYSPEQSEANELAKSESYNTKPISGMETQQDQHSPAQDGQSSYIRTRTGRVIKPPDRMNL